MPDVNFYEHPVPYYKDMCDNVSEMLVRANPKLSTNVKVMTNGKFVMLESFNACKEISGSKFKNIPTHSGSKYNKDISKFWKNADKSQAFCVLQEFDDTSVKENYNQQYETFYWSGCEYIDSLEYEEPYGILAPIWLDDMIPEKFVVFRISDPSYWNFAKDGGSPRSLDFTNDILDKCEIIKTYDLSENSKIGSYIRDYYHQNGFPEAPFTMSDDYISFNGISFDNGEFTSVREHYDDRFWKHDDTVLEFDEYITSGFERNGVIVANMMNIEFLFDDPKSEDYGFARYFGLYCNVLEDGKFKVCKENFYDKGNSYRFKINEFEPGGKTDFMVTNSLGVNLPASDITDMARFPEFAITSSMNAVFCVKDINGNLHSVSRTNDSNTNPGEYAIRLCETETDMKLFAGYVKEVDSVSCAFEDNTTVSSLSLKIMSEIPQYNDIMIFHNGNLISELNAVTTNQNDPNGTLNPGEFSYNMFCGTGTPNDIAKAIAGAFNATLDVGIHAYYCDDSVYFISMNSTPAYNQYSMQFDVQSPVLEYEFSNNGHFYGSNQHAHVKCTESDLNSFKIGNYLPARTTRGLNKIIAVVLDFDDTIKYGDRIEFPNGKMYDILLDGEGVVVPRTNQISIYSDFMPEYCRLSFFPVRDLETTTYHRMTKYGDMGELNYEMQNDINGSNVVLSQSPESQNISGNILINDPDLGEEILNFNLNLDENLFIGDVDYIVEEDSNGYCITMNPLVFNSNYDNIGHGQSRIYENFEFDTLSTTLNVPTLTYLLSEYDRCYENLNPVSMLKSKTQPWICNWVMKNGLDIREKPYRLNNNPVFGQYSFTPDTTSHMSNPLHYNQEWTYIMGKPMTRLYGNNEKYADQRNIWSYIGCEVSPDVFEDRLRNTTDNWFDVYFKRDHIRVTDNSDGQNIDMFYSTPDYMRKYSLLRNGSVNTSAETFFRGAKIEVMMKSDWDEIIDNNLDNIKVKFGNDLNGYKFSAVCVPVTITDGSEMRYDKIKVIRNDVFKTITLIVYVIKKYFDAIETLFSQYGMTAECIELDDIRRYLLYNSAKDETTNHKFRPVSVKGSGKISITNLGGHKIGITGEGTSFLTDFAMYNPVDTYYEDPNDPDHHIPYEKEIYIINNASYVASNLNYVVSFGAKITKVESDTSMEAEILTLYSPDSIFKKINDLQIAHTLHTNYPNYNTQHWDYFIVNCDYDQIAQNLDRNVFGTIMHTVNTTQAEQIVYELVDENGNVISSENGKYPYALRFIEPLDNAKYEYMSLMYDGEYITYGILPSHAAPMFRHTGRFTPLKNDVLYFTDPFIQDFENIQSSPYRDIFENSRHMNTCFDTAISDFGVIHDMAFHRTNENNSNVFKLTNGHKPIYPASNRFAIGHRDVNVFNSSWDPWYFNRTLSNTLEEECHGTLSMKENKSFFGSKCLSVPDRFIFDIFSEKYVTRKENPSNIEMFINIEKLLTDKLSSDLNALFENYIDSSYSYGDTTTITDDIEEYIKQNLLKLYQVSHIKLWLKEESAMSKYIDWNGLVYNDFQKKANGLKESNVMGISSIAGSRFDKKIILNTKSGTKYTIGLKIILDRK